MITEMQAKARDWYHDRRSFVLSAPTSSGKTVAGVAPIFESGRPALFVYPYRALLYDQANELLRIARLFGYGPQDFGYLYGGVTGAELSRQIAGRKFLLATPDKLVSLFMASRDGVMAAARVLSSFDFFFDEVHSYSSMMLRSLIYFVRSVRRWHALHGSRARTVFIFASATLPRTLLDEISDELRITAADQITGPSYTGDLTVEVMRPKAARRPGRPHPISEDMEARDHLGDAMVILDSPFDAWAVTQSPVFDERGFEPLLFVGQDKQSEAERRNNLSKFANNRSAHALIGSNAIEAGIDTGARAIFMEEGWAASTVQRLGRGGRSGHDTHVVYYGERLNHLYTTGQLDRTYERANFIALLRAVNPDRPPAQILAGLAASPYVAFWGPDQAPDIIGSDDLHLAEFVAPANARGFMAFRGLVPYTSYDSGERISYRTLFRKMLATADGKVCGSPSATKYFFADTRPVVRAKLLRVAYREKLTAERNGSSFELHYLLGEVDFGPFGVHWTILEIGPNRAFGADFAPDNIHLTYRNRVLAGPGERTAVRFYP